MITGILKEPSSDARVAMLPEAVVRLGAKGATVWVEGGAGRGAYVADQDYAQAGAELVQREKILGEAELIIGIGCPGANEIEKLGKGQVLVSRFNPFGSSDLLDPLQKSGVTFLSMDHVPRTTLAQSMDVLSSMATIAGYKAVLAAANLAPKFFPMFMSAAGTIKPAMVLVLGAGVAGLQAVATARRLGAVVSVFDVRSAAKEQVLSLGGRFVEVEGATEDKAAGGYAVEQTDEFKAKQADAIHQQAVKSDVVICTAQIPGRQAPVLLKAATIEAMKSGSVVVDLAASTGGNCELTVDNETTAVHQTIIVGNSNFPSEMPVDASRMYGKNVLSLIEYLLGKGERLNLNLEDEIVSSACVTREGKIISQRIQSFLAS